MTSAMPDINRTSLESIQRRSSSCVQGRVYSGKQLDEQTPDLDQLVARCTDLVKNSLDIINIAFSKTMATKLATMPEREQRTKDAKRTIFDRNHLRLRCTITGFISGSSSRRLASDWRALAQHKAFANTRGSRRECS